MKAPFTFSRRGALMLMASAGLPLLAVAEDEKAAEGDPRSAGSDANAGGWTMIVLGSPTQVPVPPPVPVSDAAYQAEVAAVKLGQSQITDAQRESIEYWERGGVLRWNEILLELVAKANLPPAPLENDSYPVPDANNPFADPGFPFANPPYAARAYAYVAVAQYEALKAAWHYKYLYNRPAPTRVDSGVQALRPQLDLPAYPSEDAVLSGVTTAMLQLLFPTGVELFTQRAAEQRQVALLSGRATASDIAAGLALGQAVANLVIARARADGMGAAGGNPAIWQSFADQATARGEIPWKSLESPPRPPMLPMFGRVTPWMMNSADIAAVRPGPPPSTGSQEMARELAEVKEVARRLSRKQLAIALHWNDGAGTPTPPGHWNWIAAPYIVEAQFSEVRAARALALLNMALEDAAIACWDTKFTYFNPRPSQLDRSIRTSIGLPNFPSYTSGHSTFSSAAADVLAYLFPSASSRFQAYAEEAGISRLYAAIHYRSDIEQGKLCGKAVAGYTVRFAQTDGAG
ncbi:MAG TPA: phosphatase PAP2 family protein [Bryobacteraceae bacterium]|nr:phosphatase PAP2 family protein [Bryobacteraceae bacterium]